MAKSGANIENLIFSGFIPLRRMSSISTTFIVALPVYPPMTAAQLFDTGDFEAATRHGPDDSTTPRTARCAAARAISLAYEVQVAGEQCRSTRSGDDLRLESYCSKIPKLFPT